MASWEAGWAIHKSYPFSCECEYVKTWALSVKTGVLKKNLTLSNLKNIYLKISGKWWRGHVRLPLWTILVSDFELIDVMWSLSDFVDSEVWFTSWTNLFTLCCVLWPSGLPASYTFGCPFFPYCNFLVSQSIQRIIYVSYYECLLVVTNILFGSPGGLRDLST